LKEGDAGSRRSPMSRSFFGNVAWEAIRAARLGNAGLRAQGQL
jgi:hypothetical protein